MIDGSYRRAIACGYNIAQRTFMLGYFRGLRQRDIRSSIKWVRVIKAKGK